MGVRVPPLARIKQPTCRALASDGKLRGRIYIHLGDDSESSVQEGDTLEAAPVADHDLEHADPQRRLREQIFFDRTSLGLFLRPVASPV